MRRPRRSVVLAAASVTALAAWIAAPRVTAARAAAAAAAQGGGDAGVKGGADAAGAKSVEVQRPRRMKMARVLDVPAATIEAYAQVELAARVAGYVAEVHADIGERVKAGDRLAVLAVPELEHELAEARAQAAAKAAEHEAARTAGIAAAEAKVASAAAALEVARREAERSESMLRFERMAFERREELHGEGALPDDAFEVAQRDLDDAERAASVARAEVAAAEAGLRDAEAGRAVAAARVDVAASEVELAAARVRRLETLVSFARITAPFDGVVTKRAVDPGALVQSGDSGRGSLLFVLHRVDRMRLAVDAPESDLAWIAPGTKARVRPFAFAAAGGADRDEAVARVASAVSVSTRTMRVELELDNADGRLSHGMSARVIFELDPRPNALTIPASALLVEGGATFVLVVVGEKVERRPIETGLDDGLRLEVTRGLADEDLVIVTGKGMVTEGARVRAVVKE